MDKRYVVQAIEEDHEAEVPDQDNESSENSPEESASEIESPNPTSKAPQKRRRRAVSTGVITPN